jgi:hypothetical protein
MFEMVKIYRNGGLPSLNFQGQYNRPGRAAVDYNRLQCAVILDFYGFVAAKRLKRVGQQNRVESENLLRCVGREQVFRLGEIPFGPSVNSRARCRFYFNFLFAFCDDCKNVLFFQLPGHGQKNFALAVGLVD